MLLGVSLATCALNAVLGRTMAKRAPEEREKVALDRAIDVSNMVNLAANVGVVGVTAALAMEGSESVRFALRSRRLP